jgi:nitronate monooxygenase
LHEWRGREDELEANDQAKARYRAAVAEGDTSVVPVWASEAIDLITRLAQAADLVAQLTLEAERALAQAAGAVLSADEALTSGDRRA